MSTELTQHTISRSPENTEQIGAKLGARLRGGEVIELVSDLGGGKTTLVHGLARGMGSADAVASPSFTLSREYKAGSRTLYHFDFYRLNEPGIMTDELAEVVGDSRTVVVVEWGKIIEDVLPMERLTITLRTLSENERELILKYPDRLSYMINEEV